MLVLHWGLYLELFILPVAVVPQCFPLGRNATHTKVHTWNSSYLSTTVSPLNKHATMPPTLGFIPGTVHTPNGC